MKSKVNGIIFIVLSALAFAFMGLFVRLSGNLTFTQKTLVSNSVAFLIMLGVMIKGKEKIYVERKYLGLLIVRAVLGTIGIYCNFYSLDRMVLSDASMLNKLSPFFVLIFSYFILKEHVKLFQGIMVCTAFAGAVLIVKPTGDFNNFPALIAILGGMAAGAAYTLIRLLGKKGMNGKMIVLFFLGFSASACIPFVISDYQKMTGIQVIFLCLAGISSVSGQFFITKAYFYAPANEISIYDYSNIIFSAIMGLVFLGQIPDLYSLMGYIIICFAAIVMYIYNEKLRKS